MSSGDLEKKREFAGFSLDLAGDISICPEFKSPPAHHTILQNFLLSFLKEFVSVYIVDVLKSFF
jgi:hypothetical protein